VNTQQRRPVRLGIACIVIGAVLAVVALRLCQLALVDGNRLASLARRQHSETKQLTPLRGAILDRFGDPLALSTRADSVFVRPSELPGDGSEAAVARVLHISRGQWLRKASSTAPFAWVKRQANPVDLDRLRALNIPGVGTVPEVRRFYPHGRMAASVIGFAGIDSQGLEGIELTYDGYLRGPTGEMAVERDARGRKFLAAGVEGDRPRQGANVVLTLDSSLQYVAESELDRRVAETRAKGGLVLMLDPRRGEILALAQNPSFDLNARGGVDAEVRRNRAVADAYEPGSTMKALLASAALDQRVVSASDRFFCEDGRYRYGGHTIHDHHGYGVLSVAEILQVSSNVGATKVAERLGAKNYYQALRSFGLGSATGVDLAGEQAGILRPLSAWKSIDLATASFGHGLAVTPLQLAAAYGAIANGGILMRPYIVKRVVDGDEIVFENQPTVVRRVISQATARQVTQILEGVVAPKGTAPLASVPGLKIAGKTGTAQKVDFAHGGYSRGRIASFVGYFPADDPQLVVLVIIDEPQTTIWGGTAAAPVFRSLALAAAERQSIPIEPPADDEAAVLARRQGNSAPATAANTPASFLGLSLREALERARSLGATVDVVGSGYVVRQDPPPGTPIGADQPIRLQLDASGVPLG
jgi:cell division protein FtsI (penicillin-binding protein 3)